MLNYFFGNKVELESDVKYYYPEIEEQKQNLKRTNKRIIKNLYNIDSFLQDRTKSNLDRINSEYFFPEDKTLDILNSLFRVKNLLFLELKRGFLQNAKLEYFLFDYIAYSKNVILLMNVSYDRYEGSIDDLVIGLKLFRESFPEFSGFCVHGAYSSERFAKSEIAAANELGIYLIKKRGDTYILKNSKKFSPTDW